MALCALELFFNAEQLKFFFALFDTCVIVFIGMIFSGGSLFLF